MLDDGSCPAERFLDDLSETDQAKMRGVFSLFVERYPKPLSDQKFKKIEGTDLFEFKNFQIRMPCFFVRGGRIMLTHGLVKKTDKLPASEIKRAEQIKALFFERGNF